MDATGLAVVTGAASGIGHALATRLASQGRRLVLADIDAGKLRAVADRLGARAVPTDVTDSAAVEQLAEQAADARLVCLNAGIVGAHPGPVWETPSSEWDSVLAVNLGGVVNGLRAFVPRLLASNAPAHILITASLAGLVTWPGGGAYAASKHAVVTVAEQVALSLADSPIRVTVLCPALVRSGMSDIGDDPLEVADQTLLGITEGRFLVVPEQWRDAVRQRGRRLASRHQPTLPEPTVSTVTNTIEQEARRL
jgi:NAD(P)-dependent dehydrogenase (short-subunit alcohol dehydrogenase family)